MPAIVDFPTIVQDALKIFGDLCATEPARHHCAEYLTGLMVAENKTVSGINRECALTTDQSCFNRWLTEVQWDVSALHDRRLAWRQQVPQTRDSVRGVSAIDHPLGDHTGKLLEDVGWFWDHADQQHVMAHDYLISNDVCPSQAHYPIEWRRFQKRDACPAEACKDHPERCIALIDDAVKRVIPGDCTFDNSFTSAKVLHHLHGKARTDVGDLTRNRKVVYAGQEQKLQDVARQIPWAAKKPVRVGNRRYWYCSKHMRIPDVGHPVRIVLFAQFIAVCRRSKKMSMGLRRHRKGSRLCRRCALPRRRDTPRLRQILHATKCDKLSDPPIPPMRASCSLGLSSCTKEGVCHR
jgi:hypothetical protein